MAQDQNKGAAKAAQDTISLEATPAPAPAPTPQIITFTPEMLMEFASNIGRSVADGIKATAPVRRKTIAEVPPSSVFNPEGKRNRGTKRTMFINGLNAMTLMDTLHDDEIEALDKIQPGRYLGGLLTVVEKYDGPNQSLYLWYANRTSKQQSDLNAHGLTFGDRIRKAVAEGPTSMSLSGR